MMCVSFHITVLSWLVVGHGSVMSWGLAFSSTSTSILDGTVKREGLFLHETMIRTHIFLISGCLKRLNDIQFY
jgi:hypothetical protein